MKPQPSWFHPSTMPTIDLPAYKMNGAGNAILVVDARRIDDRLTPAAVRAIAQREHFDQLMAIRPPQRVETDAFIDIFNLDGSTAGACGNGTRCVAWVLGQDRADPDLVVETAGGTLVCERLGPTRFSVDMGGPHLDWNEIPLAEPVADTRHVTLPPVHGVPQGLHNTFSAVSMGNPHAVFFVADAAAVDLPAVGPRIEHHPIFPDRANVSFAQIVDRRTIRLRVWERSAGATLACGSAACATLVAAVRAGLMERQATVSQPGGDLSITWREADNHVIMAGDTELEHQGMLPHALWALA